MENLTKKIAHKMAITLHYDAEKEAVLAYGLFGIFQITLTLVLVLLAGLLFGVMAQALTVCLSASLLRRSSGGVHAKNPELCTGISVLYCVGTAYLTQKALLPGYRPLWAVIASGVVFLAAYVVLFRKAPVDSPE